MQLPCEFVPLRTERLALRPVTVDDTGDVHAWHSRMDVCRYLLHEPRSREEVAAKLAESADATTIAAENDHWQIASVLPETGRVIGDSYFRLSSLANETGFIGWSINPDFGGRGYATEAARAILTIAFDTIGCHRVTADLDPRNDASIRVCRRLGMREEAHFVRDIRIKGDWADTGVYAILREEWRAAVR